MQLGADETWLEPGALALDISSPVGWWHSACPCRKSRGRPLQHASAPYQSRAEALEPTTGAPSPAWIRAGRLQIRAAAQHLPGRCHRLGERAAALEAKLATAEAEAGSLRAQLRQARTENCSLEAALAAARSERNALNGAIRCGSPQSSSPAMNSAA